MSHPTTDPTTSRSAHAPPSPRWSLLAGVAAFAVYLWLAPAVAGDGDSSELTLALAANGVAHPTGYPLYVLFGHLFVVALHGLGATWAYAANAWSALGAGVAIGLMHALGARLIPPAAPVTTRARGLGALVPIVLFAFNPVWTAAATMAEVYSWHLAWTMAALLVFVAIVRWTSGPGAGAGGATGRAILWGLLCGLGLAHHLTSVLVSAPLSVALLIVLARGRSAGSAVAFAGTAALAALAPLASYLTLYAAASRTGPEIWMHLEPTWSSLIAHVTGAQYRGNLGHFDPSGLQQRFLIRYVHPFVWPAVALLLLHAPGARGAARVIAWSLLATIAVQAAYVFSYGVPDPSSYFLPPLATALAALPLVGAGIAARGPRPARAVAIAALVLVIAAGLQLGAWLGLATGRRDFLVLLDRRVRAIWTSLPIDRGIVLWGGDLHHRFHHYQRLMGEKPGLRLVSPWEMVSPFDSTHFVARFGFDPYRLPETRPGAVRPPRERGPVYEAFLARLAADLARATGEPVAFVGPADDSATVVRP